MAEFFFNIRTLFFLLCICPLSLLVIESNFKKINVLYLLMGIVIFVMLFIKRSTSRIIGVNPKAKRHKKRFQKLAKKDDTIEENTKTDIIDYLWANDFLALLLNLAIIIFFTAIAYFLHDISSYAAIYYLALCIPCIFFLIINDIFLSIALVFYIIRWLILG